MTLTVQNPDVTLRQSRTVCSCLSPFHHLLAVCLTPSWCWASERQPTPREGRPEQHRTASTGGLSGYLCFSLLCPGFKMRMHCGKPRASFPQQADGSFDFKEHPRSPSYQRPFLVIIQSQVQLPKLPASLWRNKEVSCNLLCSDSGFLFVHFYFQEPRGYCLIKGLL